MTIHWEILDQQRTAILPLLAFTKEKGFYLAGGTGLALQIGHRDSIDFDFFKQGDIKPDDVFMLLEATFQGHQCIIIQHEHNTLTVLIDDSIKISFFGYKYPMIDTPVDTPHLLLAPLRDIAAMKFAAITSRSLEKDYVDIYFLLQQYQIKELLEFTKQKLPTLDETVILKALAYVDDIEHEEILFKAENAVDLKTVQSFILNKIRAHFGQ